MTWSCLQAGQDANFAHAEGQAISSSPFHDPLQFETSLSTTLPLACQSLLLDTCCEILVPINPLRDLVVCQLPVAHPGPAMQTADARGAELNVSRIAEYDKSYTYFMSPILTVYLAHVLYR